MTAIGKGSGLQTTAAVHSGLWADAERINQRILTAFAALTETDFSRRTHFLGGRFENLYLDRDRIPELGTILDQAELWAREILDRGAGPLRCGFWFNAQGPGRATSEHTHEELDELLSGVYYLSVPERSGDLVLLDGPFSTRVTPQAGLFLFISPEPESPGGDQPQRCPAIIVGLQLRAGLICIAHRDHSMTTQPKR